MTTQIIDKPSCSIMGDARDAPAAAAPFAEREEWCQASAARFIALQPFEGTLPSDVRPSQRFENEFNYCQLDPQAYERQTRDELRETMKTAE